MKSILFIEDEEIIRTAYLRELEKHFTVTADINAVVDIAIVDANIKGTVLTAKELKCVKAKKLILFSNYPVEHLRKIYKNVDIHHFILKIAYTPRALVDFIKQQDL